MLSFELLLLIECCKISLLQTSNQNLIQLINHNTIDWERLKKMLAFHSISPIVYEALKGIPASDIPLDFINHLGKNVKIKVIHSLFLKQELKRVERLFEQNAIQAMAFKGVTWSNYLYQTTFREGTDIDFLIAEKDIFRALDLLLQDEYEIKAEDAQQYSPQELVSALSNFDQIEVTLIKNNNQNFEIHLDFHWDLLIQAQTINFNIDELFQDTFSEPEKVLLIMVIHNGKRESWTKLKFICDLLLFVHRYGHAINWDSFIGRIDQFAFKKSLLMGLSLVNLFLPVKDTIRLSYPLGDIEPLIIKYWETAEFYELSFKAKVRFFRLLIRGHRNLAETRYYLVNYIRYLSYPNPREKRLFTFSKDKALLNLMSKIVSYFYFHISTKK